jgi:MOSC domain-containing protein YiiM
MSTHKKYFHILSINISSGKGVRKTPIRKANLISNYGFENDAHAGNTHRQVSLLDKYDIDTIVSNAGVTVSHGDFAENITTEGINLSSLPVGTKLHIGSCILEITQIGKECHNRCQIYKLAGDCAMPKKGVFAKVLQGGEISHEDCCYYNI